jgi:hypothetical protein
MRSLHLPLFLLALSTLLAGKAVAADESVAPTPEQHRRAVELVKQLGDRSFRVREKAARELLALGLSARKAIEEGTRAADAEIRKRCRDLLPDILQAQMRARIKAFLADRDGKKGHDLPGWKLFAEMVGKDPASRQFFVDLFQSNVTLLETLEKEPQRAGTICATRCQEIQQTINRGFGRTPLAPSELAPLFLVTAQVQPDNNTTPIYTLCNFLYQPGIRDALTGSAATPFRKLVLGWMAHQTNDHAVGQILQTAINLKLGDTTAMALKVMKRKNVGPHARAHALVIIGKEKGKEHQTLFESFLTDKGSVSGFGIGGGLQGQTQLRDVALAMLVHATGQKHADYGFTFTHGNHEYLKFNAPFLGFSSDAERNAAFKKWEAWKKQQKK